MFQIAPETLCWEISVILGGNEMRVLLILLTGLTLGMISTPNIRPFDDSEMSKWFIYNKVIVGKFQEMRLDSQGKEHLHSGVDYALNKYTEILATGGGKVIFAEWAHGYGNCIVIEHGEGLTTLYAHVQKFNVLQEQVVTRGEVIGYVGSTGQADGNHIHYELRKNSVPIFPGRYFEHE